MKIVKKRETLQIQVYEYLREKILTGGIEPGHRLVEEKIAEELDVSRSPIREAIRLLEKDGLVIVNTKGGVTIFEPTLEDFKHLFECRVELEPLASYFAAQRRTPQHIEELRHFLCEMSDVTDETKIKSIHDINGRFHGTIIEAAGNPFLLKMINQLRGVNSFYRTRILDRNPRFVKKAFRDHERIFQAIADKDDESAKSLMKDHILSDYKYYMELFTNEKGENVNE